MNSKMLCPACKSELSRDGNMDVTMPCPTCKKCYVIREHFSYPLNIRGILIGLIGVVIIAVAGSMVLNPKARSTDWGFFIQTISYCLIVAAVFTGWKWSLHASGAVKYELQAHPADVKSPQQLAEEDPNSQKCSKCGQKFQLDAMDTLAGSLYCRPCYLEVIKH